ncbi:uncharacterized protein LOC120432316 [Culex pipiens pallens]|uniref:uncharacterized protein LOC120432316 n=1 Tax=Culex pipiens pallens TaxID=42434 RepID=UPI0022AAC1DC|nr:uncharacterized protein LOC120432316 [Culex pipiens pallens]
MTDPQPSAISGDSIAQSFSAGRLGGDGEEYQRLFALMLIQRASRKHIPFELAFEHKDLIKFEDVVLHLEEPRQWWLFQNKHKKRKNQSDRTIKSLLSLSADNEFALFQYIEGYQKVVKNWKHGKHKKWFCLFTNIGFREEAGLQEDFTFEGEVKKVIIFNCGKFIQFKGLESKMFNKINEDFNELVDAIHTMFKEGLIENSVTNCKALLLPVINATESEVTFSKNFLENQLDEDLFDHLVEKFEQDLGAVSSNSEEVLKFWNEQWETPEKKRKTKIPSYTSKETIQEFFKDFILAYSQPDLDELEMLMSEESRLWMRDWIRPDDFGRFSNDQIGNFFRTFKKEFINWEKPVQNNKSFLRLCDGNTYLKQAEKILRNEVEKCANRSCVSFEQIEGYYINRQLKCQSQCIKDVFMVDQLPKNEEQFYAVTAEPGMGKSTLMQYLAYNVQRKYSDVTVFLLYSSNFHGTIPSVEQLEDISNKNVFKSFLSPENIHLIVKDDKTKINLFIDALDELSVSSQYQILKLIKVLLTKKNLKIVVSCRNHVLGKLSNQFGVKLLEIQAFTEDEQKQFFIKVWKDISDNRDTLESFSNKLIQKINNDIDCNTNQFTSLPLTIKMVTEIYSASYKKYCKFRKSVETFFEKNEFNVVVLFENITSKCIKIAINKKCKVDNNAELDPFFDSTHKAIDNDYQIFAAKYLFANDIELIPFITNKLFGSVEGSIKEQQSLLVEIQSGSPEFTHESYREYFAAKFLFEYVGKKPIIYCISEILEVLIKHKIMRNFFFGLMYSITKNDMNRLMFLSNLHQVVLLWSCDDDNVFQDQSLLNQAKVSIIQKICDYLVSKITCKSDADESIAKTSDTNKPLILPFQIINSKAKQNSLKKKDFWRKYKEMIHLPKSPKNEISEFWNDVCQLTDSQIKYYKMKKKLGSKSHLINHQNSAQWEKRTQKITAT